MRQGNWPFELLLVLVFTRSLGERRGCDVRPNTDLVAGFHGRGPARVGSGSGAARLGNRFRSTGEDHEDAEAFVAGELVVGPGRHEDRLSFDDGNLFALDVEDTAALE